MNKYLLEQLDAYDLQLDDVIKLLFQGVFGGGHLIDNEKDCLDYLIKEIEVAKNDEYIRDYPLTENISDNFARLNLAKLSYNEISPETASRMFMASSNSVKGDEEDFYREINDLCVSAEKGLIPFSANDVLEFVYYYLAEGIRPIHHSNAYNEAYAPHYRVISRKFADNMEIIAKISKLLKNKRRVVVGIDGKAAAGKSTLSAILLEAFDATVIRADDYFVPKNRKTAERMAEVGGNIDYERMKSEVFDNLGENELLLRKFDCKNQVLDGVRKVPLKNLVIVEGSYSFHPYFNYDYDLKIFMNASDSLQLARIKKRNGDFAEAFIKYFIPMENKYFEKFKIMEKSDIIKEAN